MSLQSRVWSEAPIALVRRVPLLLALLSIAHAACGEPAAEIEIPALTPALDGSVPMERPDGAADCDADAACDDDVECTRDFCAPGGFCVNAAESSRCSDGVFCNGLEVCDAMKGCRSTDAPSCDDDDVCTIDVCDDAAGKCEHAPRDFDDDGEIDWHCEGGTDCDDFDLTRGANVAEICADAVDNDCDETVDEQMCGAPAHDQCEDALDVSAGGVFELVLSGARHDYALGCGDEAGRDVAFVLELEEARDVTLVARGLLSDGSSEIATIALREDCEDRASERECKRGFPASGRLRALPAGRYFVIAHSARAAALVLEVQLEPATEPPTNTSCESALDVSAGGHFEASMVDIGDGARLTCGLDAASDLAYAFTLDATRDVRLLARSATGERMAVSVRSSCDEPGSELRCISDAPAFGRLHRLGAGTYYAWIEGAASREVDFVLDVAFEEPTDPPPGDSCEDPLDLRLGSETDGSLAGLQDLVDVRCGCEEGESCGLFLRDAVHRIDLDEDSDLAIAIEGGGARMHYALLRGCGEGSELLACGDGAPVDARVQGVPAGEYFLVVESPVTTGYVLEVDALPPRPTTAVSGNDTCDSAFEIAPIGGVFEGDTTDLSADYAARCGGNAQSKDAVFVLRLAERTRVRASLSGEHDPVLYRFANEPEPELSCVSTLEQACDDDSGSGASSLIEETLDPGTYYYVVDGFSTDNAGRYTFDVSFD